MIKKIKTKSILTKNRNPSSWFGCNYLFNIYRGCEHKCIYCDSMSLCYRISNFHDLLVKENSIELLQKEISKKRTKIILGTGSMSDPYTLSEKRLMLTRKSLEVVSENSIPIHITTKSNLILRDIDILQEINKIYASVSMTITTSDDNLSSKIEPFAPVSSERYKALGILNTMGINTSITMMPILPFLEDNKDNIVNIVKKATYYGVKYIVPFLGMTLRDRQKDYYFKSLDKNFPGLKEKYIKRYSDRYKFYVYNINKLGYILKNECNKYNINLKMPTYKEKLTSFQLSFFNNINF